MDKFEIYKNKGLSGLNNIGNTCFINSCLQILSHTYELNNILDDKSLSKKVLKNIESELLVEWNELRNILWHKNCKVSPNKFITTIHKIAEQKNMELFTEYRQNDVTEFLLFLIDCFHSSLQREIKINIIGKIKNKNDKIATKCYKMIEKTFSKQYSEIWELFYGIHVSFLTDIESTKDVSSTPEPFFMINLSLPDENALMPTLYDCFDAYIKPETMTGDNAWYYEKEKRKINVKKQLLFWSLPPILVIDLKRFNHNNKKNNTLIRFPLEDLNLDKYIIGYNKNKYKYELYGICNHIGGLNSGHYTSYVKNANGKWYSFNDLNVIEIKSLDKLISNQAYCLFYRRN